MHVYVKSDYFHLSYKKKVTDPFEYCFLVVTPFHEQNNFPTCVAIDRINLKGEK